MSLVVRVRGGGEEGEGRVCIYSVAMGHLISHPREKNRWLPCAYYLQCFISVPASI